MRALVAPRYGSSDVLRFVDVPEPVPAADEVLIRVYATTVNRTDLGVLVGTPFLARLAYGLTSPKHPILGCEFAGTIEAVGDDVSLFELGDRVFGFDGARFGSHAPYKVMRETSLIDLIPEGVSFQEAAPASEGACYSMNIIRKGGIDRAGGRVAVYGATGSIGSAAVQLAQHFGATVTAVGDTGRLELMRSLGDDRVVDYTQEHVPPAGETYDVVIDAVGKTSYLRWRSAIAPDGSFLASDMGPGGQNIPLAIWTRIFGRRRVAMPLPRNTKDDIRLFGRSWNLARSARSWVVSIRSTRPSMRSGTWPQAKRRATSS
jgi:NADPH:quinone reductase-like Zn-dependent oxidoreductase